MNIQQERDRFERYARAILLATDGQLSRLPDSDVYAYHDEYIDSQWLGWVARAEWGAAHRENAGE